MVDGETLVGRELELAALANVLGSLGAGSVGCVLYGPAGSKLFHAGDAIGACRLLATAVSELPPGRARALARLELADVVFYQGGTQQAVSLCRQLARIEQAAELLRLDDAETHPDLYACVRLMLAYYRFYNGLGLDRDGIAQAHALVSAESLDWTADWARMTWRSVAKFIDLAATRDAYAAEYDLFDAVGDESSLGTLAMHLAEIDCRLGNWQLARREAERSMAIVEQAGQRRWRGFALYARGLVDAHWTPLMRQPPKSWNSQPVLRTRGFGHAAGTERVARMAADGMTNREIGAAAFVSTKSVEANLSRVYHKLGISSRRQLSKALRGRQM